MPAFSDTSHDRLITCHIDLIVLFETVVRDYDCTILCGHRNKADQDAAFEAGRSHLRWPHSKHNAAPSHAVDVMPYPVDWSDIARVCHFAGYVQRVADELGVRVTWGGHWQTFKDYPHWELQ